MDDEKWLREGLHEVVPEPQPAPDRATGAMRRARAAARLRTTALVGGAAGAAVAVAVATTSLTGGPAVHDPTDRSAVDAPVAAKDCPPAPAGGRDPGFFDEARDGAPDVVPQGATSARLCPGNGHRLEVPPEVLTVGVDRLVDAVNELPRPEDGLACTEELGYGYRIVFGYPDGSRYHVSGALYGCGLVVVGAAQRQGADELLREYAALLREQRAGAEPPALPPDRTTVDCGEGARAAAVARPDELELAVLCVRTADGMRRAEVAAVELAVLRADLRGELPRVPFRSCPEAPQLSLVGLTALGERVALPSVCGTWQLSVPDPWSTSGWPRSWSPGPAAREVLDDLVARAR
ncbi:hypothetical protein G6553_09115 [Nocardioides sp. IC4_145]|uniref:hypothetical protein n=1 Tax=Nocardioides sp. IC4_145 TaxID=2714037 RepID=UPI00140A5E17|nr:hypothetical protein [Nocardioides sp. IC4_145]NHC23331.1 hypothetical protein [Nocardioides sp. IC4_145]